ncbi:hypothetical protein PoMZ_07792 [Pyricularia oryzae]|uniref:Uncharacterized protein n=1 Tax=Pyricularia oryzae TaxID=318829 RepID=A0A4P7NG09_PYROR|nr:hypothetical protein PoMZ_07792 [Pyricularia oryzae]
MPCHTDKLLTCLFYVGHLPGRAIRLHTHSRIRPRPRRLELLLLLLLLLLCSPQIRSAPRPVHAIRIGGRRNGGRVRDGRIGPVVAGAGGRAVAVAVQVAARGGVGGQATVPALDGQDDDAGGDAEEEEDGYDYGDDGAGAEALEAFFLLLLVRLDLHTRLARDERAVSSHLAPPQL